IAGPRRLVLALTVGMVVSRLALQFWTLPEARMWLGAATIVLAGWLLPLLLTRSRPATAYGVGMGLALDVALRISRDSLDLAFSPSIWAHMVAVVLAALAVLG